MKYLWSSIAVAAVLVACGEESTSGSNPDGVESSSSISQPSSSGDSKDESAVSYGEMTDPRDSKTYKTITLKYFDGKDSITSDTWMAEDLAYNAEYADQVIVENGVHLYARPAAMDSLKSGCGYWDLDNIWYCGVPEKFQGICPDGWRMPTSKEASHFASILKGNSDAEAAFYHSSSASECEDSDYFWTSTELGFGLFSGSGVRKECVNSFDHAIESFAPVRCLKGDGVHVEPVIPTPEKYKGNFGTLTDSRDDKTYKTVKIGEQTWMAENLDYEVTESVVIKKDNWNSELETETHGRAYSWTAAMEACPQGWHLPSQDDYKELLDLVSTQWPDYEVESLLGKVYEWEARVYDAYGFGAMEDRTPFDNGDPESFHKLSSAFWTSSEGEDASKAVVLWLNFDEPLNEIGKTDYAGVRCLKNK